MARTGITNWREHALPIVLQMHRRVLVCSVHSVGRICAVHRQQTKRIHPVIHLRTDLVAVRHRQQSSFTLGKNVHRFVAVPRVGVGGVKIYFTSFKNLSHLFQKVGMCQNRSFRLGTHVVNKVYKFKTCHSDHIASLERLLLF